MKDIKKPEIWEVFIQTEMKTTCISLAKYKGLGNKKICKSDYQPYSILKACGGVIVDALRSVGSGLYFVFWAADHTTGSNGTREIIYQKEESVAIGFLQSILTWIIKDRNRNRKFETWT